MATLTQLPAGVQCILKVGQDPNFLYQNISLIQDADDRGTGTGIRKFGLPGGAVEHGETKLDAITREVFEEIGIQCSDLRHFGTYDKIRSHGCNDNHLFVGALDCAPDPLGTNDTREVSKIVTLPIGEIINLTLLNEIHEGSVRLILYYLKGVKFGSLNERVYFDRYSF